MAICCSPYPWAKPCRLTGLGVTARFDAWNRETRAVLVPYWHRPILTFGLTAPNRELVEIDSLNLTVYKTVVKSGQAVGTGTLRHVQVSGEVHHRPRRQGCSEVHWRHKLDFTGYCGLPEQVIATFFAALRDDVIPLPESEPRALRGCKTPAAYCASIVCCRCWK